MKKLCALLLAMTLICGCFKDDSVSPEEDVYTGPEGTIEYADSLRDDTLRVASFNMAIGFDVGGLFLENLNDLSVVIKQTNLLLADYLESLPVERVKLMAQGIAAKNLDVIGLQEVTTMILEDTVHADFLTMLIQEIESLTGIEYKSFFKKLNEYTCPYLKENDTLLLTFSEGNAVLVKPEYSISDSMAFAFSECVVDSFLGEEVESEREAIFLEVISPKGKTYQLFSTHIEVAILFFNVRLQNVQISDLLFIADSVYHSGAAQIIMGDMNIESDQERYTLFTEKNWVDAQEELGLQATGTCCVENLRDPQSPFSNGRIDYVFARGITKVVDGEVALSEWGVTAAGDTVFAADHRMVVAEFETQY
ncbi:endonuclease/exonuclease/phosphatase family protein [Fibrobacterota bacterium]